MENTILSEISAAKKLLNVPVSEFSGETYESGFPVIKGNNTMVAGFCKKLGATLRYVGRSGFAARNSIYICVGATASAESISLAKKVLSEARRILTLEQIQKFQKDFETSSYDGGLTGFTTTGGDFTTASHYEVVKHLPHFVYVGDIRTGNTSDGRQGRGHTYQSYFLNKEMVPKGDSEVVIRLRDRDHFIFIGKGGETIKRLQRQLGVRIQIRNPQFSEEVFDDFLSYATSERQISRLPKRYERWVKIHRNNLEAVEAYKWLYIRAGGELPRFGKNELLDYYRKQFAGKQINGLARLFFLMQKGELRRLDISQDLISQREKILKNNPEQISANDKAFKITYEANFGSGTDFHLHTSITNADLEGDELVEGITLPGGRKVELRYKDNLPGGEYKTNTTGLTKNEIVIHLNEVLQDRFTFEVGHQTRAYAQNATPDSLSESQGFFSSVLWKKLADVSAENDCIGISWTTKINFGCAITNAVSVNKVEIDQILAEVAPIAERVKILKGGLKSFFGGLKEEECRFFLEDRRKLEEQIETITASLLGYESLGASGQIEAAEDTLESLKSGKDRLLEKRSNAFEKRKESVPAWLLEYLDGEEYLDMAIDCVRILDAIEAKLGRMNRTALDSISHELSVGKGRRASEMKRLCQMVDVEGLVHPQDEVKQKLEYMAGNNKSSASSDIHGYLLGSDDYGGEYASNDGGATEDEPDVFDPNNPMHVAMRKQGLI